MDIPKYFTVIDGDKAPDAANEEAQAPQAEDARVGPLLEAHVEANAALHPSAAPGEEDRVPGDRSDSQAGHRPRRRRAPRSPSWSRNSPPQEPPPRVV